MPSPSPSRPTQAVILAGGLGTRLRPLTDTVPKPMIPFHGKPFAEYLVEMLQAQGFREILFLLGYLPDVVTSHFGDGSRFGVKIDYSVSPVEDETGLRLKRALGKLDETFLLLYCDNYWPLDMARMWPFFLGTEARAMITVYANDDGYTKDNIRMGPSGLIEAYDKTRTVPGLRGVELGYGFFPREIVAGLPEGNVSFEKETYGPLAAAGELAGYVTGHRYYSVGSHARLPLTDAFLARRPAILLDRDGTLNRKAPQGEYVRTPDEFAWLPGAREALRLLREADYRVFLISNQAGIARGALTRDGLEEIHRKMVAEAEEAGGRIDGIYVCPHHWDEGCACRKPKPGMLFQAQREHHLDLSRTWFLGDDPRDAEAGAAAGCLTALVGEGPDDDLLARVRQIVLPQACQDR